jgi:hypothetical protein
MEQSSMGVKNKVLYRFQKVGYKRIALPFPVVLHFSRPREKLTKQN